MAKTANNKKSVFVHGYTKKDKIKVKTHYRSTPSTSKGSK